MREAYVLTALETEILGIPAFGEALVILPNEAAKAAMAAFVEESLNESFGDAVSAIALENGA